MTSCSYANRKSSRQLGRISALEADDGAAPGRIGDLQSACASRFGDQAAQGEIATRDSALNEHATELERLRAAAQESADASSIWNVASATHTDEVSQLQGQVAERDARVEKGLEDLRLAATQVAAQEQEQLVKNTVDAMRAQLVERGNELTSLARAADRAEKS